MIDVAVIGAGRIGRIHAGNIVAEPRLRLRYVVDPVAAAAADLAEVEVDRLLAEHRLAGGDGDERVFQMLVGRAADQHAADRRIGEHRVERCDGRPGRRGDGVGRARAGVDHMREMQPGVARGVPAVHLSHAARADQRDLDSFHEVPVRPGRLEWIFRFTL